MMNTFTLLRDNSMDSTVIPNWFIDDYMAEANDAQLKIYLYLMRSIDMPAHFSISHIADKFNHTESDVIRSLKYWESKGLLSLQLSEQNEVYSIRLLSCAKSNTQSVSNTVPIPVISNELLNHEKSIAPTNTPAEKFVSISKSTNTAFEKPCYSLDQIKIFKSDESYSQILFVAEQYLGKTLSANDIHSILFITDALAFSEDLIDYLLQYCVERGKRDFRYIEKVAINWAENNIKTPTEAENFSSKYDKSIYAVMNALGKSNVPTAKEVNFINRWNQEFAFTTDIILEACERTVLATDKHRFEYADKILSNWKRAGIHHKTDILKADSSFKKSKTSATPSKTNTTNKFNQFHQNDYDFDEIEQRLLRK